MSAARRPGAALPPPILSDTPGTWAYDTVSKRIRETILAKIPRENELSPDALEALAQLDRELQNASETRLRRLQPDAAAPDIATWNDSILPPYIDAGCTWLTVPWVVAEFYFYRRVLEAVRYFERREDPFELQKRLGLESSAEAMGALASRMNAACSEGGGYSATELELALSTALWGNRMDLSIWPVGGEDADGNSNARRSELEASDELLANDLRAVAEHFGAAPRFARADIVVDNAGFELFCDLCLADYLCSSGAVQQVVLQLKAYPVFVSDAMAKDVRNTIDYLASMDKPSAEESEVARLGERWRAHVESGRWRLHEDLFWVQPAAFWEMPEALYDELREHSALVVTKGDANYRRLLGDLEWPFDVPFRDVACYFPAPICALRTFKAEIACGVSEEDQRRAAQADERWLVSGRFGVIQFYKEGM